VRSRAAVLLATPVVLILAACSQSAALNDTRAATRTPANTVPAWSGPLSLMQVHLVSASTGWAFAVPGERRGLAHLVRTTDSGDHWTAIGLPSSLMSPNLDAIDAHDELHAWMLVTLGADSTASHELVVVVSTSNGGRHWTTTPKYRIDGHGTGVQFVDPLHGWIFATAGAGGAPGAADTTLYRTADGGTHWQAIKSPSQVRGDPSVVAGLPEPCPMGGGIGQPTFADPTTGWLGASCHESTLYVTHDGGLGWAGASIPSFPGPAPSATDAPYLQYGIDTFARLSANDVLFALHRGVTTGANALQEAALYVTHDQGASWQAWRLPAAELAVDFVDPMHGWMIGAGPGGDTSVRSLYSTLDGGRNWRLADGPADFFGRDLSFGDPLTGLIAVPAFKDQPPQLRRTTDGGATWARILSVIG
jgi:photosystem II stability/assembly factor-like uncharacterized protein